MVENEWKWIQMVQTHYETLYWMTKDEWKWIQMRIGLRQQKNQEEPERELEGGIWESEGAGATKGGNDFTTLMIGQN